MLAGYSSGVCGRFTLSRSAAEIAEHFDLPDVPALAPRYNVAPGQDIAVVRAEAGSGRALDMRRWGFVPAFARRADERPPPINARLETAHEKKSFRDALRRRRCLVPADGFYEWQAQGSRKLPHHLALAGGGLFAMAGLFEDWEDAEGRVLRSVVLLTTEAQGAARDIHHRMPVILSAEQAQLWLDPAWDGADAAGRLTPEVALGLRGRPVGRRVNDVRNDDAACLELEPLPLFDQ